jgi:hypothetical protein
VIFPAILIAVKLPDLPIVNVLIVPLEFDNISVDVSKVELKLVPSGSITKLPDPVNV